MAGAPVSNDFGVQQSIGDMYRLIIQYGKNPGDSRLIVSVYCQPRRYEVLHSTHADQSVVSREDMHAE